MAEEYDFDVIVVGGGVAGTVCSYLLAKEGHEVLLLERGTSPGSKNLSGGVFYSRVMDEVFPDFAATAPVERVITRNVLGLLTEHGGVAVDYLDKRLAEPVNAVSVLRATLDPWLAEQCEEAGVTVMPGIKVDELVREGEQFMGVRAGEDTLTAKVIVAADGVNSFLAQYAGIRDKEPVEHLAVGVKSVLRLGEEEIARRFNLTGNEGAAYALVGEATGGVAGGGFLYTNRDTVSVGVVLMLGDLVGKPDAVSSEIHDRLLEHPFVKPLVDGGELLEYGCHMVAEGGVAMQHDLVHPGLLLIGDAAGFTLNTGFTVRGMDLAAGSARSAARAISAALQAKDYSAAALQAYVTDYERTFVGKDMETYRRAPHFFEHTPELYGDLGEFAADALYRIYNHDLTPRKPLVKTVWGALNDSGMKVAQLARIGWKAVRAL